VNYARRQQYRRLSRAAPTAMASAVAVLLALSAATEGAVSAAGLQLGVVRAAKNHVRFDTGVAETPDERDMLWPTTMSHPRSLASRAALCAQAAGLRSSGGRRPRVSGKRGRHEPQGFAASL
jgi:hypothetical protein